MTTVITRAYIDTNCSTLHADTSIVMLNAALTASDQGTLDTYLTTLDQGQAWDLYDIAGDLDETFADNLLAHDEDLVGAINWIALSAKAVGQGH